MKRYQNYSERIWSDAFLRELYFGGVLFTELLHECYETGSSIPMWLMNRPG